MSARARLRPLLAMLCAIAAGLGGVHAAAPAPDDASGRFDYRLQARQIAPGVYVFVGHTEDFTPENGGNILNTGFIVGTEGIVVVDTGSSRRYGEQMLAAIRRVSSKPIELTLNTHHHPDHFLGNQAFPRTTLAALEATVAGIANDGEAFNENLYRMTGDWMKGTERIVPAHTLEPGRRRVAGRDLEFLALTGHTAADLVVIDHDTGTVFAGDLIFNGRAPTTPHADLARWLEALEQLERVPARQWIPGHGAVATDATPIHETRAWLHWIERSMRQGAEAGLDMTEMLTRPLPAEFSHVAEATREYRRSVVHLFPTAEQAALEASHAK